MNIVTMLHFGGFLVDVWLIIYVMSKNPGALPNRLCAFLIAAFAFWSLSYGLAGMAGTAEKAVFFINVGSIGSCLVPVVGLWCCLAITNQGHLLDRKVFLLGSGSHRIPAPRVAQPGGTVSKRLPPIASADRKLYIQVS